VIEPRADELARACRFLLDHDAEARAWGRAGRALAENVTWDRVLDQLLP
jgi:glycosyltransferase involved in cell wall biosynthesis